MVAKSELDVIVQGKDNLSPTLDKLESRLIRFVGAVSSALTAFQIAAFPVKAIREFEAAMADVQKTTGFTDAQIKTLGDSLVDMSRKINVSAKDLAAIAAAAGQQGLGREGVEGIEQFTESVSRMASVLDLTVDQAGTDIGKIASIFKVPLRDIERAVSSFNEVANNSTASGEQLLDVVKRIGDAAGSLDLAQSIGLSATGIDLGLSPEVVGTSFSKVFAEMYARAGQFSDLLGVSVEDWMKQLQTNGIDALKLYLDGLRKLTPEAQQQTIKALSGGGRIGVLVTKLLRDTEDEILDRNVEKAVEGITTGTSALEEQQTVLKTLDAETQKLANSFQDLGIIAGEKFVAPLAGSFAQLNEGLASEGVIQFAEASGEAIASIIKDVADLVRWINELNVNWENFIQVGKVWIGLKLAQALAATTLRVTGLGAAWTALATKSVEAGEAQEANSKQTQSLLQAEIVKVRELIAARQAYTQSLKEQEALTAQLAQNQKKLESAQVAEANARGLLNQAKVDIGTAGVGVAKAKDGVAQAQNAAAAREAAVQETLNQKLQQAEQKHQQRLTAIQYEFMQRREVARSTGSRKEVALVNQAEREALAAQEATYAKSLRSTEAYYKRRLAIVQQTGIAEVGAARLALMQSFGSFDEVVNKSNVGQLTENFSKAGDAVERANRNLQATQTTLTASQRMATAAASAFTLLGTGVRLASAALQGLIAIAGRVFFWLTVIYTVVDALGITEKLGGWFEKLTDAMGLTSEASRILERDERARARAHDEARRAAEEAAEGLNKLVDAQGKLTNASVKQIELNLDSEDLEDYRNGLQTLVEAVTGAQAKLSTLREAQELIPVDREKMQKATDEAVAILDQRRQKLEEAQALVERVGNRGGFLQSEAAKVLDEADKAYTEQAEKVRKLQEQMERFSTTATDNIDRSVETVEENMQQLNDFIQKTFTKESADAFLAYVPDYISAVENQKRALADMEQAQQDYTQARGTDSENEKRLAVETATAQVAAANSAMEQIAKALQAHIDKLKETGGLTPAVIGSLDFLPNFLKMTQDQLQAILGSVNAIKKEGGTFSGTLAPPVPKPDQGEGTNDQQTDAEARRLARSRIDLKRAELQSIAELEREANDQASDELERAFDNNLVAFRDYYSKRQEIQERNLEIEANLKRQEIEALQQELSEATEESEQNRINASITRSQGQLDVLAKQKEALAKETEHELQNAVEDFRDRVKDQRQALADYFGASSDQEAFNITLESVESRYREFLERLRVESENMPELLPLIDAVELEGKFQAVESALDLISRKAAIAQNNLDLMGERVEAMEQAGLITRGEAIAYEEKLRRELVASKKAAVDSAKARLDQLVKEQGEAAKLTLRYQELKQSISQQEVEIEKLQLTANETAQRINDDFRDSIEQGLISLTDGTEIEDAITDFFLSVISSIRNVAAEGLADTIVQAIGSVGNGGLGGFFANIMGETADSVDTMRGATPATPMFVKSVDEGLVPGGEDSPLGGLLGGGTDDAAAGAGEAAGGATDAASEGVTSGLFEDTFESLGNSVSDLGSSVMSGLSQAGNAISDGFSSGINLLMSVFTTVGNAIVAAIFTASATDATASGLQAAGTAAAAAHNGGIAGRTTMRRTGINPAVFANAVRHHTGGIAGAEAGLKANEVPVILEEGEEVLTKQDPRHRDNLGVGSSGDGSQAAAEPIFRVQPVLGEDVILDAMKGAQGEKLLLVHINKNPMAFRRALKLD